MLSKLLAGSAAAAAATPTFVSSSINRVATAGNTVTAPTGIQNGDLLVAVGFNITSGLTITPPTGFNVIHLDGTSTNTEFVAVKTASSESGNYTFTWSGAAANTVAILVYRNATYVNTIGSITRATSGTGTASSITPTYEGTLVAVFAHEAAVTVSTPPSGLTQKALVSGLTASLGIYDLSGQAASATSSHSLVWSAPGEVTSFQFFVTNEPTVAPEFVASASAQRDTTSGYSTVVIDKPTGTVEGDLMISVVAYGVSGTARTWTGDTEWTEIADQNASSGPNLRIAYKVATASEPSSYTFRASAPTTSGLGGSILTYRYAAYDAIGTFATGADPLVTPSVSPSQSQSFLVIAAARPNASATISTPTSMTNRVTNSDATAPSWGVSDQVVAKGTTGTRSITTGSTSVGASIMLAIKPTRSL